MTRRALLVKTSSLGDVLHLLPAVTEAVGAEPSLRFDWLVEPAFAEIPAWHTAVDEVIEAPVRSWRTRPRAALPGLREVRRRLASRHYDVVIDAQGLLKSAVLACLARGRRVGFDAGSARESLAARAYGTGVAVAKALHAIDRSRLLLGAALGHEVDLSRRVSAGLTHAAADAAVADGAVWLLPSTTWATKHWPEAHWVALARRLAEDGLAVRVPYGAPGEAPRAQRIAAAGAGEAVAPTTLTALRDALATARVVVGVDTGPLHLAAALDVPVVALHGPTDPLRTGPRARRATVLSSGPSSDLSCSPCGRRSCASALSPIHAEDGSALEPPCLGRLSPERVHRAVRAHLAVDHAPCSS